MDDKKLELDPLYWTDRLQRRAWRIENLTTVIEQDGGGVLLLREGHPSTVMLYLGRDAATRLRDVLVRVVGVDPSVPLV